MRLAAGNVVRVLRLSAAIACVLAAVAAPNRARGARPVLEPLISRVDSMYAHGQSAQATALLDSVIASARAAGDSRAEIAACARRASALVFFRRHDEAVAEADRLIPIARSLGDTLTWCRALLVKGRSYLFRSKLREAEAPYRQLLPLARAIRVPVLEGNARLGLAYLDLEAGRNREAERGYRAAVQLLERGPERGSEFSARVGLARTLADRGDYEAAKATYRGVIARSRALGDLYDEADAWNNLGVIESERGDPSRATAYFTHALTLNRQAGRGGSGQVVNLAILLVSQGRFDEASTQIETELARTNGGPNPRERYELRTQLGVVRRVEYRIVEAERILRAQWAAADSVPGSIAAAALNQLALLLLGTNRFDECRTLLRDAERQFDRREPGSMRVSLVLRRAEAETRSGRPTEALGVLARLTGLQSFATMADGERSSVELQRARAHYSLGQLDSAAVALQRATSAWERARLTTRNAEWLEVIGNGAGSLAAATTRLLLDPRRGGTEASRAREAFDALQRFKARALEFRLASRKGAEPARPARFVTADLLQHRVLRPGEALVDFCASWADTDVVFLVDRNGVVASRLDPGSEMIARIIRLRDLVSSPDVGAPDVEVARGQARLIFGATLERVRAARRVIIVPTSLLATVPLGLLIGTDAGGDRQFHAREVAYVPSANWLANRRAYAGVDVNSPRVVGLARSTGLLGRELPGIATEMRWLRGRYAAEGITHHGERSLADVLPWLGRGDVLHVAAHAEVPPQDPWSSALLLGRGDDEGAWLTARDIASRTVQAKLVVLASCSGTVSGHFTNETNSGLSSAFLAAGAPVVLSAQWPVDDRATAEFVRAFYRQLEGGTTVSAALHQAQAQLAAQPGTRAPFYWAGFVLWGDPEARIELQPRGNALLPHLP